MVLTKTRGLGSAVMLSVGTLWPFSLQADQPSIGDSHYTMTTPDAPLAGYVTAASVAIKVKGPSGGAPHQARLTLNGQSVTASFSNDGGATVSGLKIGRASCRERV